MQSQVDLIVLDNIRVWIFFTSCSLITVILGIFHGKLGITFAEIIFFIGSLSVNWLITSFTITLIVKSILVFKPHWFDVILDEKLVLYTRIANIFHVCLVTLINYAVAFLIVS